MALATGVVRDLGDADGLLRPLLRSVAMRLADSRRPAIGRVGERYLRLDPPPPGVTAGDTTPSAPTVLTHVTATGECVQAVDEHRGGDDIVEGEVIEEAEEEPIEKGAAAGADA